jgi:hypothetical protein
MDLGPFRNDDLCDAVFALLKAVNANADDVARLISDLQHLETDLLDEEA